ncbi:hypothetical protein D1007_42573 [Hordeum vulgare]|nr:hypothetical protein D1007_42573 [Hordeum vulgare]
MARRARRVRERAREAEAALVAVDIDEAESHSSAPRMAHQSGHCNRVVLDVVVLSRDKCIIIGTSIGTVKVLGSNRKRLVVVVGDFFRAAQAGDLNALNGLLAADPALARRSTLYVRLTAVDVAAANGCLPAVDMLLAHSDVRLGERADVPAPRGVLRPRRLPAGHPRRGAHHAGGRLVGLRALRQRPRRARRHAAACGCQAGPAECVHLLLESGAVVSAPTGSYGFPGSTALHLAARGGSLECVRELLAWGADRVHRDSAGRIAYSVATKRGHGACMALLNPAATEPMVWPSPLKFIGELGAKTMAPLSSSRCTHSGRPCLAATCSVALCSSRTLTKRTKPHESATGMVRARRLR